MDLNREELRVKKKDGTTLIFNNVLRISILQFENEGYLAVWCLTKNGAIKPNSVIISEIINIKIKP